ncbi:hypothetical protein LIER_13806 [Lithospermum erythrorhizon]|uniref:Methyltransferase small domain-containing protein n=1 Tax=Lithospermum erythrorhizon TaxID=34254 RepID=A0AAV3PWS4_LITER
MLKLSITRASLSVFQTRRLRHIHCSTISCAPTQVKLQTPLFLRPPDHKVTLADLKKWHLWAKNISSLVGSRFLDIDNGPDSTLLHRELDWFIEDAIEQPKSLTEDNYNMSLEVSIRASLDDLYRLWNQRIEERRPFQYIVGCEHWRDLVLCVQEGVLIPRLETELIVDLVENATKRNAELKEGVWADLGTGSGALAIGVGMILGPSGRVIAVDLSPTAVAVASYNVQRYLLQDTITVKQGSWFEPLKDCQLTGIVSNPPYIPSSHISGLQAEVAQHEPRVALDGGADGLDDLLHICNGAASLLKPGGFFAFETNGEEQSQFLANYLTNEAKCFYGVEMTSDFAGIRRFVTGYKKE